MIATAFFMAVSVYSIPTDKIRTKIKGMLGYD
jgi:hypothetical protein